MNKTVRQPSSSLLKKALDSRPCPPYFRLRGSGKLKTLQSFSEDPADQADPHEFMVTKRAKLYSKGHSKSVFRAPDNDNDENICKGMSNFQILKRQAEMLQNSSILKGKMGSQDIGSVTSFSSFAEFYPETLASKKSQKVLTETNLNFIPKQYVVNNEFISFKKISVLDKHRQNIKKLNIIKLKQPEKKCNLLSGSFLEDLDFQPTFNKKLSCELKQGKLRQDKQDKNKQLHFPNSIEERQKQQSRPRSTFSKEQGSSAAKKFYQSGRYKNPGNKFSKSYCEFLHPNLKAKAMQMSTRQQQPSEEMVIICL